jgi:hypothetical protein
MAPDGSGYDAVMSESSNEHETPEVGLIPDEDLPEDLQPTDDNPLAQDPSEAEEEDTAGPGGDTKVEGMPDLGEPGPG